MNTTTLNDAPHSSLLMVNSMDPVAAVAEWFSSTSRAARSRRKDAPMEPAGISANLQAVMNGILGDSLAAAEHPLAIPMTFRVSGQPLVLEKDSLIASLPKITDKLIVLIHGLCMHDLQWPESILTDNTAEPDINGSPTQESNGACLTKDYNCVYLHYNTGHHISTNGQELSTLLETLIDQWPQPVTELVIIGNSMGGLVARSACHYSELAGYRWLSLLSKLIFVGVPHHGSHWERLGNWVDIKLGSHWEGRDRFAPISDSPQPVPLPREVDCYTIAATLGKNEGNLRGRLMGDGIVPLDSALGRHVQPELCLSFSQPYQSIFYRMHHMELLRHPQAFAQIKAWLGLAVVNSLERQPRALQTDKSA